MEVDFTQYYIIVRHHCEVTSIILGEHGEEHARIVKRRFWDILSSQKEQDSALNLAGGASDHAQGDVKKVSGYFVTNKRARFVLLSLKHMLVMVSDLKYKLFNCVHAIYASWCKRYLNVTISSESYFMNYQYLYQEVDIDNTGPVWVLYGLWRPSVLRSLYDGLLTRWVTCNKKIKDIETPNVRI